MLGYIRSQAFEQQLPAEKEQQLFQQMYAGDEKARHLLIEHNMRLVAHIAKKYASRQEDLEEYISIGSIGLLKAASSYTPDKKTKLSTYAASKMKSSCTYAKSKNKNKRHPSTTK